jgi:NadR type nicotinamide-nucleotide adenylyltransferase
MATSHIAKIAIVGPESTGKSTLSKQLASHFNTCYVPEMSRVYLENLGRKWEYGDVLEIAKLQIAKENECLKKANKILFCDTELICIKVWLDFYHLKVPEWLIQEIDNRVYHHFFLMDIDLTWEADLLRENPNDRAMLFAHFKSQLNFFNKPYSIVSGSEHKRFLYAIDFLKLKL